MDLIQFTREFGLPTIYLAVLSYACWTVFAWAGKEVVIPLRNKHMAFLESLEITLRTIADTQNQIANEIASLKRTVMSEESK